jgi:hypothetical protein
MKTATLTKHVLDCDLDGFDCEDETTGNCYSIFYVPYMGEWLRLDYIGNRVESQGFNSLENHIEDLPEEAIEDACINLDIEEEKEEEDDEEATYEWFMSLDKTAQTEWLNEVKKHPRSSGKTDEDIINSLSKETAE